MYRVDIYGEDHSTGERRHIESEIRKQHKKEPYGYLLLEELGPHSWLTEHDKKKAIRDEMYSNGPLGLELALELDIPAIGIDLWADDVFKDDVKDEKGWAVDVRRSFRLRETAMLATIRKYRKLGNVAVILGDAHIRTTGNDVVGNPSAIWTAFRNDPLVTFYRSRNKELE